MVFLTYQIMRYLCMFKLLKTYTFLFSLSLFFSSCSRKASDYQALISSYKGVMCSTMSSLKSSVKDRKEGLEKLTSIKIQCREALKYLKQEEKEKFNQMISQAELDVAQGNCN